VIPSNLEILGSLCFLGCKSLTSISFESNSRLKRIESQAFFLRQIPVVIPSTILFVAHDALSILSQLSLSDPDLCPAFHQWKRLRESGIVVNFQRTLRSDSCLPGLEKSVLDRAAFEGELILGRGDLGSTRIYWRRVGGALAVVKSASFSAPIEHCMFETEIENLLNLRHPTISPCSGLPFPWNQAGVGNSRLLDCLRLGALSPPLFLLHLRGGRRARKRKRLQELRLALGLPLAAARRSESE
jgi:hypothetical protein